MLKKNLLVQRYELYTAEDVRVWHTLFTRQMQYLQRYATDDYLKAVEAVGFHKDEIPHFQRATARLQAATGWQLAVVPELVPTAHFFSLLAQRIFPATAWLRTYKQIDYLEEPDMFHDVFGHVPLLMIDAYADFMEGIGKLAMKWIDVPEVIKLLGRIYWFTIEFGLIEQDKKQKIYGAGIISSATEAAHSMSVDSIKSSFNLECMLQTGYRTDVLQDKYFVISSFNQLYEALPTIDVLLREHVDNNMFVT